MIIIAASCILLSFLADDKAREETRATDATRQFGVSGRGVAIGIIDRGIDWENNDFRNPDGTTRIDSIFDMTDPTGANAAGNTFRTGTIYTREQIDAALNGGPPLAHRDAVGHGTATAGIAAGNGRNSRDWKYRGYAPKATLVIVKMVAGAAAHDDQPAEATFSATEATLPDAIDFARERARQRGMPMVMLPNIGSVTAGPADGTSTIAKKIDASFGPGIPGLVFVTGSSDDGGRDNHAQSSVAQGQSVSLQIDKADGGALRLGLWYPDADRYEVTIQSPSVTAGPYTAPAANTASDSRSATGIAYHHYGSAVTPYGAIGKRQITIDFSGPAGRYVLTVRGTTASGGSFHAWLNTNNAEGQFKNLVVPGYTVWDAASARNNISPNDYVLREKWADTNGVVQGIRADRVGDLWTGSGVGPTPDGRLGVDVSAPGNTVFAPLAPRSRYSLGTKIQDGAGFYVGQNAVSGASPQVTGIIALMLELNPKLDAAQVKRILQQTARRDSYTGPDANPRWGYGKVDALAAVTAVSQMPGARPYYSLDRNEFSIDSPRGRAAADAFPVQVTPGNGAGDFEVSTSADWLHADLSDDPSIVMVSANPAGLENGDYDGEITLNSRDGAAVPQSIMVHLHVRKAGPMITNVVDAAAEGPGFANGSRIIIRGFDLSTVTREWRESDFLDGKLPTSLDGVRVRVFDRDGFPYFISPNEIRLITPDNSLTNTRFGMVVINPAGVSNTFVANTLARNPEFFRLAGTTYANARFVEDGGLVGPDGISAEDIAARPALPGEAIQIFGTGCGQTEPAVPADRVASGVSAGVTAAVSLLIGGKVAAVSFAGVVANGVCRVDAIVPAVPAGDAEVVLTIGVFTSADGVFLKIGG